MLVMSTRSIWRCSPLLDSAASTRHIARLKPRAVRLDGEIFTRRIDLFEHPRRDIATTQDSTTLGDDARLTHHVRIDDEMSGDVHVARFAAEILPAFADKEAVVAL